MLLFLVFINVLFKLLSSHSDHDSCNLELSENHCTKCDSSQKRNLTLEAPFKCLCNFGWYDPGEE